MKNFVHHFCKKLKCKAIWLNEDLTNAKTRPPKWKYCKDCCEKYGYSNPELPPQKKDYMQRIERLKNVYFNAEKNQNKVHKNNFNMGDIQNEIN